jgi:hypothetical protein
MFMDSSTLDSTLFHLKHVNMPKGPRFSGTYSESERDLDSEANCVRSPRLPICDRNIMVASGWTYVCLWSVFFCLLESKKLNFFFSSHICKYATMQELAASGYNSLATPSPGCSRGKWL